MGSAGVVGARRDSPATTAFAGAWLSGMAQCLLGVAPLGSVGPQAAPSPGRDLGVVFLVGEEVPDQAQPMSHNLRGTTRALAGSSLSRVAPWQLGVLFCGVVPQLTSFCWLKPCAETHMEVSWALPGLCHPFPFKGKNVLRELACATSWGSFTSP